MKTKPIININDWSIHKYPLTRRRFQTRQYYYDRKKDWIKLDQPIPEKKPSKLIQQLLELAEGDWLWLVDVFIENFFYDRKIEYLPKRKYKKQTN